MVWTTNAKAQKALKSHFLPGYAISTQVVKQPFGEVMATTSTLKEHMVVNQMIGNIIKCAQRLEGKDVGLSGPLMKRQFPRNSISDTLFGD